ncbi:branched-chain amino acid ABC transporter permease [Bradyrhizobium sp. 2TAF24]|uniref:branched-chain amino acid ABC transporter permease n=1 Tax=Bradyrhizobium sp. 2TAF24 TaxID=3233011 RepID=UPI003F92093D
MTQASPMISSTASARPALAWSTSASHGSLEIAVLAVAGIALWFAPAIAGDHWLQLGFRIGIFLVLAQGWNLMAGSVGLVSLGTSCFVGLGGYVAFGLLNHLDLPLPLAFAACAVAGSALAALVSPALFRLRGLYFTVGTLALAELLRLTMINVPAFGGATGLILRDDPPALPVLFRYALALAVIASLAATLCGRSRAAVIMHAVRDDADAAAQLGVRTFRVKLAAFMLASALTAMAGGLQAVKLGAIEPYGMFGLQWSIDVLSMVVIGGVGRRLGPLVGAVLVVAVGEALADYPELHVAITGAILIVLIRFAPHGLVGLAERALPSRATP